MTLSRYGTSRARHVGFALAVLLTVTLASVTPLVMRDNAVAEAGATGDGIHDGRTVDDHLILAMEIGGIVYYGEFHFYAVDDGSDLEVTFQQATADLLARFPGAVVVEGGGVSAQYLLYKWRWKPGTASWSYNPAGKPSGLSGELAIFNAAAAKWTNTPADFTYTGGGVTSAGTGACGGSTLDKQNTIGWAPQTGAILAITCAWFYDDETMYRASEFDIQFDPDYAWTTGSSPQVDLLSVATHEFGHALGLGHSAVKAAVMYAIYDFRTLKRQLDADDIAGQVALYGQSAQTPTPTPTPAPTRTATPVPTPTPTATPANTPTPKATATPTRTPAAPPTLTPTPAVTAVPFGPANPPQRMNIPAGASLVTWPYVPAPASEVVDRSGDAIDAIYAYDGASGTWRLYGPALSRGGNSLTTLQTGYAYWILTSDGTSLRAIQ